METPNSILQFWFGNHTDAATVAKAQAPLWWQKDAATDDAVRARFAGITAMAARHELDAWCGTPQGRLALILLTDQFPRNMYRDTPKAFHYDALAQAWCRQGLACGHDLALRPIKRVFFYLPLEHAEALDAQQQAVALFTRLVDGVAPEEKPVFAGYLDFAVRHRDIIARFGRFPHRNQILGRPSTADELAFLQQKGSSF